MTDEEILALIDSVVGVPADETPEEREHRREMIERDHRARVIRKSH